MGLMPGAKWYQRNYGDKGIVLYVFGILTPVPLAIPELSGPSSHVNGSLESLAQ